MSFHSKMFMLAALVAVPPAAAQRDSARALPGDRVRVAHRCRIDDGRVEDCRPDRSRRTRSGTLQSIGPDTVRIVVEQGKPPVAFPSGIVEGFWVAHGKHASFWSGAGFGLGIGAVAGGLIGATKDEPGAGIGVMIGAPIGLALGGMLGIAIPTDRWVQVPLQELPLRVAPAVAGLGIRFSIGF